MRTRIRFATGASLATILVLAGGLAACSGSTGAIATNASPVANVPSSTPGASASPPTPHASVPLASPSPSFDFGGAKALYEGTHLPQETTAGVSYYTAYFAVPFTISPGADWWVRNNIRTLTSFERGPNDPPYYLVQFVVPTKIVLPGNTGLLSAPVDLLGWLRARSDLVLSAPVSITVAGITGSMVEGGLRAGATLNPEGGLNLICGELSECGWEGGQLIGIGPGRLVEFIVIEVRGTRVVIALNGPAAHTSTTQKKFDTFLKTFTFPTP